MNLAGRLNYKTQERFVVGEERDLNLTIYDADTLVPFNYANWTQVVRLKNADNSYLSKTPTPVAYNLGHSMFRLSAEELALLPRKKSLHLEVKFTNSATTEVLIVLMRDCLFVEEPVL